MFTLSSIKHSENENLNQSRRADHAGDLEAG
jgi:hypothetical protein